MEQPTEQKKSKLKFFAAYFISVFLIIVIFAALWQGNSAASTRPAALPVAIADDSYRQADALLHKRMEEIDALYPGAIGNDASSVNRLKAAETAFSKSLDSLETTLSEQNGANQNEWQAMVSTFRTALQARSSMMTKVALLKQNTVPANTNTKPAQDIAGTTAAMESLRALLSKKEEEIAALETKSRNDLAEKGRTISALQEQVRRGSNPAPRQAATGAEEEWKKKYNTVKARHAELNQSYNALSASFQSVVADNRRLLGQLQQSRKQ